MMAETADMPSWILLLLGIYSFAAGVGELRRPGLWHRMLWEVEQSSALQFLTGVACIVIGGAIYLANPWNPKDIGSILVTVLGAWILVEGFLFLAFGDVFLRFTGPLMRAVNKFWALGSALLGLGLIIWAIQRFQ